MANGTSRALSRMLVLATLVAAVPHAAPAAPDLPPPGMDGFSERVLAGVRFRMGPRSAAVAPDGTVHVVYGGNDLRHAWNDGTGWRTEVLDATLRREMEPSLAIDAQGHLHVAYTDSARAQVLHGTDAAGAFAATVVAMAASEPLALTTAVAVAPSGAVHVAWRDAQGLSVASNGAGTFAALRVASDPSNTSDFDLAVDPEGRAHLVYGSGTPTGGGVRGAVHLWDTGSGWSRDDLESADDVSPFGIGEGASLAFDAAGQPHVVYAGAHQGSGTRPLRHAWRQATTWFVETLVTPATYPRRTRTVFDAAGAMHVFASLNSGAGLHVRRADGEWTAFAVPGGTSVAFALAADDVHVAAVTAAGVSVQTSASGGAFSETTLDRRLEPLLAPSVAVDAQGDPRIAIVRQHADGARIDLVWRTGAAWTTETVASGVLAGTRPSIRVDAAGATHVAWATADGGVRAATNAAGSWAATDVVTGLASGASSVALAITPSGARRVLFRDDAANLLRIASEISQGWDVATVAAASPGFGGCDVECDAAGAAHVAWIDLAQVSYATDAGGSWQTSPVFTSDGSYPPVGRPGLALDAAGSPAIAFPVEWQFFTFLDVATSRPGGGWDITGIGTGDLPALAFDAAGALRATAVVAGIRTFARPVGGAWTARSLDAGFGRFRRPSAAPAELLEGAGAIQVDVQACNSAGALASMSLLGAAFDAAGAVHAAYVDGVTGDLRYATDRDPGGSRAASVVLSAVGATPGAAPGDLVPSPAVVAYRDADDSGTKHVLLSAPKDGLDEFEETFALVLSPGGGGIATASHQVFVTVYDADPTPPPPPPPVDHGTYFLPLHVARPSRNLHVVSGTLHTGTAEFDPAAPARVVLGGVALDFEPAGHRGARWTLRSGAARMSLVRDRALPWLWRFSARLPRSAGEPDLAGPSAFSYEAGEFAAASTVFGELRRLDVARGVGAFSEPGVHVTSLTATAGEAGRVTLAAFADLGPPPDAATGLTLTLDPGFTVTIPALDANSRGDVLTLHEPGRRVVLDFGRRSIRVDLRGVAVEALPDGDVAAVLTVAIRGRTLTQPTLVRAAGGRIRR